MTLKANPLAQERLAEPRVITVVDGVLGPESLAAYPEAAAQVTSADVVVISKVDLAEPASILQAETAARALNPWAAVTRVNLIGSRLSELFALSSNEVAAATSDIYRLFASRPTVGPAAHRHSDIVSHSIVLDSPLDWNAFGVWMTMLLHRHGGRVLRVKGLLAVDGLPGPTLFQSAQHLVHAPVHMDAWPSADRKSRIVFIVRDIDVERLETSLRAFDHAARNAVSRLADQRGAGSGGVIAGRPVKRPTTPAWIRGIGGGLVVGIKLDSGAHAGASESRREGRAS
ncbi:MAG: GTP-binding protein [Hyphomicrobium sp.]